MRPNGRNYETQCRKEGAPIRGIVRPLAYFRASLKANHRSVRFENSVSSLSKVSEIHAPNAKAGCHVTSVIDECRLRVRVPIFDILIKVCHKRPVV